MHACIALCKRDAPRAGNSIPPNQASDFVKLVLIFHYNLGNLKHDMPDNYVALFRSGHRLSRYETAVLESPFTALFRQLLLFEQRLDSRGRDYQAALTSNAIICLNRAEFNEPPPLSLACARGQTISDTMPRTAHKAAAHSECGPCGRGRSQAQVDI
jgi:hypothetical protein